jgi:hypothetical protein
MAIHASKMKTGLSRNVATLCNALHFETHPFLFGLPLRTEIPNWVPEVRVEAYCPLTHVDNPT